MAATDARQHIALQTVTHNGVALDRAKVPIERIEVRNYVGLPDMATVRIADPEGVELGVPSSAGARQGPVYKIGDPLEIRLGHVAEQETTKVFTGEVVALEPEFTSEGAAIVLRAYDKSHRLHRNRRSRTFQDVTVTDVVTTVTREAGLTGDFENTTITHPFVLQSMETDLDFLNRLAAAEGYQVGVADGKAFLRKAGDSQAAAVRLRWGENTLAFKPRVTGAQQPAKVTAATYDPGEKKRVVGEASTPTQGVVPNQLDGTRGQTRTFGDSELVVADRVAQTQEEARTLAQGTLDRLASGFVEAEGVMLGDPHATAGGKITLEGFGPTYNGDYTLSAVTHVYGHGDYRTRFTISGRSPRTLTDVMRPKAERDWTAGLVIGLVTNVNDPLKLGRVRVKLVTLGDTIESAWARVAMTGAGPDAGLAILPMVNDEVVIAFEHGDTRRPVVLGALHNGKDTPKPEMLLTDGQEPPTGGKLGLYGRKDGEVNLVDKLLVESSESMTLKINRKNGAGDLIGDAAAKIDVKAGDTITIASTGEMKLTSRAAITLEATSNIDLKANGNVTVQGNGNVTVQAAMQLTLKGNAGVDIQAAGTVNVRGALINLG